MGLTCRATPTSHSAPHPWCKGHSTDWALGVAGHMGCLDEQCGSNKKSQANSDAGTAKKRKLKVMVGLMGLSGVTLWATFFSLWKWPLNEVGTKDAEIPPPPFHTHTQTHTHSLYLHRKKSVSCRHIFPWIEMTTTLVSFLFFLCFFVFIAWSSYTEHLLV